MDNLLEFNREQLTKYIEQFGHKPYRAKQLLRWIYYFNEDNFGAMTDVAKSFQNTLTNNANIQTPEIISDELSLDGTRKWLLNVGQVMELKPFLFLKKIVGLFVFHLK